MADLYVCSHGATNPCDECKATRIALMFAMRKELDPDAPDMIAFPEPESSTEKRCEIHGGIIGCPCGLGVCEREKIATEVERMYGPHALLVKLILALLLLLLLIPPCIVRLLKRALKAFDDLFQ